MLSPTNAFAARMMFALALLVLCVAAASAATTAQAATGPFCPPDGGTRGLYAYRTPNNRDRCAHAYHNGVDVIIYGNSSTNVRKCAVLKPNSNGSGGNVGGLTAACAPRTSLAVQSPLGLNGYATGINQGTSYYGGFFGSLTY